MACGTACRFRKPTAAVMKMIILPLIIICIIVINVSSSSLFFGQYSSSVQIPSSDSLSGEIGPKDIRSMSEISNSELLHFILTNGTGDVSKGGRMPIKIVEPFIQRLQASEEREKMHEKSLNILANSLLEQEIRIKIKENNLDNDDNDDNNSDNNNNDETNGKENIKQTGSKAKRFLDSVLDKAAGLNTKKREVDDDLLSLLVKRMLDNAIVRPPPPPLSQSLLSSSSSSSSSKTTPVAVEAAQVASPKTEDTQSEKTARVKTIRKVDTNSRNQSQDNVHMDKISKDQGLPDCKDANPNTLVGKMRVQLNIHTVQQLQSSNMIPDVEVGGHTRPMGCVQKEKTAIIIPFRDREKHLAILLLNLFPVLKRQGLDITIFVIDENMPTPFNRGMLFNIGFLEANKLSTFDCFIFHDVDLIPINDKNIYQCDPAAPVHFLAGVDKFNYTLPYRKLFGGVVAFTKTQYQKINGASNLYFGWGGEDDDLRKRSVNKFRKVLRKNKEVGQYDMIKHGHRSNNINPVRGTVLYRAIDRQDVEGLNTTIYHVTSINRFPLYTKISVDINFEQMLKTAPGNLVKQMKALKKAFTPVADPLQKT